MYAFDSARFYIFFTVWTCYAMARPNSIVAVIAMNCVLSNNFLAVRTVFGFDLFVHFILFSVFRAKQKGPLTNYYPESGYYPYFNTNLRHIVIYTQYLK